MGIMRSMTVIVRKQVTGRNTARVALLFFKDISTFLFETEVCVVYKRLGMMIALVLRTWSN